MTKSRPHIGATVLLLMFHISTSNSAKSLARPVHEVFEVINEQARIDDKRIQTSPGLLPYGNPLAGNSQHNAKLHAQNQQAMFNAERIRQHRAQLQRLNKGPTQTDSYMRAYHESQENHQLALEQQQATLIDKKPSPAVTRPSVTRSSATSSRTPAPVTRSPLRQRQNLKRTRGPDLATIMQEEAASKEKSRNHRSYGSVEYQQYLQPQRYKTVYVSAGPTYDQGVTIKPNGNVGIASLHAKEEPSQLFTQAIPSKTQYVYPKQYSQMQQYESAQDIASLNALLKKQPDDQLTEFNALIHSDDNNNEELKTPIDLYFYLKDPSLAQNYAHSMYAQIPQNYASAYMPEVKDHTPITEEVDDVEDPNMAAKRPFTPQPTQIPTTPEHITAINNFYSVEPTVATSPEYFSLENHSVKPSYEALKYEKPLTFYSQDLRDEDTSEKYLHQNGKHIGIQHLNEDGTGVSAYGDDNVSIASQNNRNKRSIQNLKVLETDPFILPNISTTIEINETIAKPEALKSYRLNFNNYKPVLASQNYPVDDFEDKNDYEDYYDDYNLEYDEADLSYGTRIPNYKQPDHNLKGPSRVHQHSDLKSSHSQLYAFKRNPNFHNTYLKHSDFSTSYGVPDQFYQLSDHELPSKISDISSVVDSLEPVYMLTESQLKNLIGHHNLNIQHLDIYQSPTKTRNRRPHRPRKYRKKGHGHSHFPRTVKKNLFKLHKLKLL